MMAWPRNAATGERNGNAKLTADDVRTIRAITGETQANIAAHFGVTRVAISNIRTGRTWKHVA